MIMKNKIWKIKEFDQEIVDILCKELGLKKLFAILLNVKGITNKEQAKHFLQPDLMTDLHNPFLFKDMEKAVNRLRKALEQHESIFIFGDRDVDGISSSAMVYNALKKVNAKVKVYVPSGASGYGITETVVEQFKQEGCALIITVDNGIVAYESMRKAKELGMDVIITDHHTPGEKMPEALAIINPKCEDNYPFKDLAGVGVAYKLLCGLFFSYSKYYNKEMVVLDFETTGFDFDDEIIEIGAIKLKNFIPIDQFQTFVKPNKTVSSEIHRLTGITEEQLQQAQPISHYVKDFYEFFKEAILIGHNIKGFDINFIRRDVQKYLNIKIKNEMLDTLELSRHYLKLEHHNLDKVALYFNIKLDGIYHTALHDAKVSAEIFKRLLNRTNIFKKIEEKIEDFSEYVVLGTLADVVALLDENRLIVKKGIEKLKDTGMLGFRLLLEKLNIDPKAITTKRLSWKILPILNAPGRMGLADKSLKLLISDNKKEAEEIVNELLELNKQRKDKQTINFEIVMNLMEEKVDVEHDKIFIIDVDEMEHGVTGVIANRLVEMFYRPVVIIILKDGIGTGRSIEQFEIFEALKKCEDLFLDFGGHKYACGFTIKPEKFQELKERLKAMAESELKDEDLIPLLNIDTEIEPEILNTDLIKEIEQFLEPFGEDNDEPLFLMRNVQLHNWQTVGQQKKHLKLRIGKNEKYFFNALFWNGVAQNIDFIVGTHYDIVFRPEVNVWNNTESVSLIVEDIKESLN